MTISETRQCECVTSLFRYPVREPGEMRKEEHEVDERTSLETLETPLARILFLSLRVSCSARLVRRAMREGAPIQFYSRECALAEMIGATLVLERTRFFFYPSLLFLPSLEESMSSGVIGIIVTLFHFVTE